jgi:hypothetical protein
MTASLRVIELVGELRGKDMNTQAEEAAAD